MNVFKKILEKTIIFIQKRKRKGYLLFELLVASMLLASSTAAIIQIFLVAERKAVLAMVQNRVSDVLRAEVETVISTNYSSVVSLTKNVNQLFTLHGTTPTSYTVKVDWVVYDNGPNGAYYVNKEPPFKIVNVQGVWKFRNVTYTNIIQTVATP
jgi:hypothetical protein